MLSSINPLLTIIQARRNIYTNVYKVRCKKDASSIFLTRMVKKPIRIMSIAGPLKIQAFSQSINEDLRQMMILLEAWGLEDAYSIKCINQVSTFSELRITRRISAPLPTITLPDSRSKTQEPNLTPLLAMTVEATKVHPQQTSTQRRPSEGPKISTKPSFELEARPIWVATAKLRRCKRYKVVNEMFQTFISYNPKKIKREEQSTAQHKSQSLHRKTK